MKFVSDFVNRNRNAATRIWYRLSQMATRLKEDIKNSVAKFAYGNAYGEIYGAIREHQEMLRKIEDMRDMFGRALMEAKKTGAKGERAFGLNGLQTHIVPNMSESARAKIIKQTKLEVVEFTDQDAKLTKEEVLKLKNTYKSEAEKILKTLARKFGVFGTEYSNSNIELEFKYSGKSLLESVHKQNERNPNFYDFAKMLYVFRDLVENAQPIETHTDKYVGTKRENPNLEQTYILLSAFKDGDYIIPVEFCIKKYRDNTPNGLYVSVTLKKIEANLMGAPSEKSSYRTPKSTSTYSLSQIIKNVNPLDEDFLRYIRTSFYLPSRLKGKGVLKRVKICVLKI